MMAIRITTTSRRARWALVLCLAILAMIVCPVCALADEGQSGRIRVGYYENEVFEEGATDDAFKTGYAYEYYQKLSEYTGWRYTYVYGDFTDLYQMLVDGDIDLLAGLAYRDDRSEAIGYPDLAMGNESYYLVKHDDDANITDDPATLNGHTIGVLDSAVVSVLNEFLYENEVDATLVTYDTPTDLFAAFDDNAIDVLAAESDGARGRQHAEVIDVFGTSDYYLCASKSRPDILAELNDAQMLLESSEPSYLSSLKAKYYSLSFTAHAFTQAEREWLDTHTSIRVGYFDNYLPFSGTDSEGNVNGAVTDIMLMGVCKPSESSLIAVDATTGAPLQGVSAAQGGGELVEAHALGTAA